MVHYSYAVVNLVRNVGPQEIQMQRRNYAFTLIELLVVIAIIAILAAILFPVFAQAKAAAKKIASVSNMKQHGLSIIMYANDYDDMVPAATNWEQGCTNVSYPLCFGDSAGPWTWLVSPYVKSGGLYMDPQAQSISNYANNWELTEILYPDYGYNYVYLCPWNGTQQQVISMTSIDSPANMVMIANKWSETETNLPPGDFLGFAFNWASDGPLLNYTVEVPNCGQIPQYCACNWGTGCFTTANTFTAGNDTGGDAIRAGNQAVTGWMDGHANSMPPGALAVGTNWSPTLNANNLVFNANWQTTYLWNGQ